MPSRRWGTGTPRGPHECRESQGRKLTSGNYGSHTHFRPKQTCSLCDTGGVGGKLSWHPGSGPPGRHVLAQTPVRVAILSGLVWRLCLTVLQEGQCRATSPVVLSQWL